MGTAMSRVPSALYGAQRPDKCSSTRRHSPTHPRHLSRGPYGGYPPREWHEGRAPHHPSGDVIERDHLRDQLLAWGFERVDYVYEPGQFALRGSIVDIYSFASELPYRLDFFR